MVLGDSKTVNQSKKSVILKLWIPFVLILAIFIAIVWYLMKKESWTIFFINSCVLFGLGIRWLSRCIMYMSTSNYVLF